MNINQLLDLAVTKNASDLHLVVGFYPQLRIHGELLDIPGSEVLTPNELDQCMKYVHLWQDNMTDEKYKIKKYINGMSIKDILHLNDIFAWIGFFLTMTLLPTLT